MIAPQKISLLVSYCQLVLFETALADPFNDWTEQHTAQGFSWRPECVAFGTLEEFGEHTIFIRDAFEEEAPLPAAVRVIDVPFDVPSSGRIMVASVADNTHVDLSPGLYQLRFQAFARRYDENPVIHLIFRLCTTPVFKIVRADANLIPGDQLLLTASPA